MTGRRDASPCYATLLLAVCCVTTCLAAESVAKVREAPTSGFVIEHEITLPDTPEAIYDAVTGDISGWWDHSFSDSPHAFYIEPRPGGGFYELFNESGDGVLHGTVIYADRGKILRFAGPLGFSGNAVDLVCSYKFTAQGDSTLMNLTLSASGQINESGAQAVDDVWYHFLFERLKPYVEEGRHKEKTPFPLPTKQ